MLLAGLLVIALALTCTMFATRQAILGFPCAMFWAITGAQAYTQSTAPWGDVYFYMFFVCALGMTIFTMFAAFGLREKRDTLAEEEMDKKTGKRFGEREAQSIFDEEEAEPSKRTKELRKRAKARRSS